MALQLVTERGVLRARPARGRTSAHQASHHSERRRQPPR